MAIDVDQLSPEEKAIWNAGQKLFKHPEVSKKAKRLLKEVDPTVRFAEIDLEDQLAALKEDQRKENETRDGKLREIEIRRQVDEEHRSIRDKGYDVAVLDKIRTDYGVVTYDKAMKIADLQSQQLEPTATAYARPSLRPENDFKGKTPEQAREVANNIAHTMISEFKARRRA